MPEIPKVVDRRVNYDKVAPTYDQRYGSGELAGIATALLDVSRRVKAERALEVGFSITTAWYPKRNCSIHSELGKWSGKRH